MMSVSVTRIKGIDLGKSLFYISFCLLCLTSEVGGLSLNAQTSATWESLRDALGIVVICLLALKLCIQTYTPRALVLTSLTLALGIAIRFRTGDSTFFYLCLLAATIDGAQIDNLAKIALLCGVSTFFIAFILSLAGVLENRDVLDPRAVLGIRYSLGFLHPNVVGKLLVSLAIAFSLLPSKNKISGTLFLLILLSVSYFLADSRTATISIGLLLIVNTLRFDSKVFKWKWTAIVSLEIVVMLAVTLCLMIFFNPSINELESLNKLLSFRPEFWHGYYQCYGIAPFGSNLQPGSVLNLYGTDAQLDGAYAVLLVQYGWLSAFLTVSLVLTSLNHVKADGAANRVLTIFAITMAVGLMENYAISPVTNIALIGIGCSLRGYSPESFFCYKNSNERLGDQYL